VREKLWIFLSRILRARAIETGLIKWGGRGNTETEGQEMNKTVTFTEDELGIIRDSLMTAWLHWVGNAVRGDQYEVDMRIADRFGELRKELVEAMK
jgi:hypothetical protein